MEILQITRLASGECFAGSVRQIFTDERARRIKIEATIRTAREYS